MKSSPLKKARYCFAKVKVFLPTSRQTWLDIYLHKKANLSGLLICDHTLWTAYLQLLLFISEGLNKYMHKMEKLQNKFYNVRQMNSRRANLPDDEAGRW
jgi:hypothetical protein